MIYYGVVFAEYKSNSQLMYSQREGWLRLNCAIKGWAWWPSTAADCRNHAENPCSLPQFWLSISQSMVILETELLTMKFSLLYNLNLESPVHKLYLNDF